MKPIIIIVTIFVISLFLALENQVYADITIVQIATGSDTPRCAASNSCYIPYRATISVGDTIIWKNLDSAVHTVTAGISSDGPTSEFGSGALSGKESFTFKPETVGEFPYFCMLHPWMKGMLIVTEATIPNNSNIEENNLDTIDELVIEPEEKTLDDSIKNQEEEQIKTETERENMKRIIDNLMKELKLTENRLKILEELEKAREDKEQKERDEQERQLKKEVAQILQSESYQQLEKLRKGVKVAEDALKQVVSNTPEQKETIDKAWDLLKDSQRKLKEIEENYQKGDSQVGLELYDSAKNWYNVNGDNSQEIGDNLKEISRLIEEVQSQTCFLFWCW